MPRPRIHPPKAYICPDCGNKKKPKSKRCSKCSSSPKQQLPPVPPAPLEESPVVQNASPAPPPTPEESSVVQDAPLRRLPIRVLTNPYGIKPGTIIRPEYELVYKRCLLHVERKDRCGGELLAEFVEDEKKK